MLLFFILMILTAHAANVQVDPADSILRSWLLFHFPPSQFTWSTSVVVSPRPGGGRGLVATQDIANKGHVFLSIPLQAIVSTYVAQADQSIPRGMNELDDFAMFLLHVNRSTQHKFRRYVDMLPGTFDESALLNASVRQRILDPFVELSVKHMLKAAVERCKELERLKFLAVERGKSCQTYLLALALVQSRTFTIRARNKKTGVWDTIPVLVPIADMMNLADHNSNVDCETNTQSTHFECFTTRPITAGQELFVPIEFPPTALESQDAKWAHVLAFYGFELSSGQQHEEKEATSQQDCTSTT